MPSIHNSWLVGLAALSLVNGAAVDIQRRQEPIPVIGGPGSRGGVPADDAPPSELSDDEKCALPFDNGNADENRDTWLKSGAEAYFSNFLKDHGTDNWSHDMLAQTVANGKQGGSQYSCGDINFDTCSQPSNCDTYSPREAFYVHLQSANLFAALKALQMQHIQSAVVAISSDIHQIVADFGVVKDDGSAAVFKALLGVIGSLTGLNGVASVAGPLKGFAFGGSVLSLFSSVVGFGTGLDSPKTAEAVQGEITDKYGQMFQLAMGQLNETTKVIFGNKQPDRLQKRRYVVPNDQADADFAYGAVHKYFADGVWLDRKLYEPAVLTFANVTATKMLELCLIQAMKDNQQPYYMSILPPQDGEYQFGGQYSDGMNEEVCGKKSNCHWFDNHCLCFERQTSEGGFVPEQTDGLGDADMEKMKKWVPDLGAALQNNYECVKDGWVQQDTPVVAGDRENPPPFDINNPPPNYFKCFWNLNVIGSM